MIHYEVVTETDATTRLPYVTLHWGNYILHTEEPYPNIIQLMFLRRH
jgi:hypothetical protein